MFVNLTAVQIAKLKKEANMEVDREIYSISFTLDEITINQDWSTPITNRNKFRANIISAIEYYCTQKNVEWEYNATYSAYCD